MLRVRQLETEESWDRANVAQDSQKLPLPCHYFDNIVGTSAGGLISVMLGRLRMDVNECIQQYFTICNAIFRPHQYIGHYNTRSFENAINGVIRKYCKCHGPVCAHPQTHLLRQYDYLEFDENDDDDPEEARKVNGTCKVAVIAQRKAHGRNEPDMVFLMRSYNHRPRRAHAKTHSGLNLGQVQQSALKIWEACRATSAAPFFFKQMLIDGCWYIDGGVGDNNPSTHAWNEARLLNTSNNSSNKVAALISIGTGMTEPNTKFGGLLGLVKYARKAITETETSHKTTRDYAQLANAQYFRFDVRPIRGDGLSKIKLDECKKKKRKPHKPKNNNNSGQEQHQPQQTQPFASAEDGDSDGDNNIENTCNEHDLASEHILAEMDLHNSLAAAQPGVKGGYKPEKYEYTTFRTIKRRTDKYCRSSRYSFLRQQGNHEPQNVKAEIEQCARLLVDYSRRRRDDDLERWRRFRRHPDPQHEANRADPPREA